MDKKDELILKQLDMIRQMSNEALKQLQNRKSDPRGVYRKVSDNGEITYLIVR